MEGRDGVPARRHRPARVLGFALAVGAMAAGLGLALDAHRGSLARYDRFTQPGFDARVYLAMAEAPAFFTLKPWGYRLLAPWLVYLLEPEPQAGTFLAFTLTALLAAGLLLYAWLRRLGHAPLAAALGVAAFALSPPVSQAVRDPFLAEPFLVVLLAAFLLALEARAGLATLALIAALGALGKDVFLLFLPAVFFARRSDRGARRAAGDLFVVALPALAVTVTLRAWWTPHLPPAAGAWPGADVFWLALWRILEGAPKWLGAALLLGVTPLAACGALTAAARPFLWRYGWLLAATWALPFAASVYTADTATVPFFADDIPRLLLYALPPTLHLALLALERARAILDRKATQPQESSSAVGGSGGCAAMNVTPPSLNEEGPTPRTWGDAAPPIDARAHQTGLAGPPTHHGRSRREATATLPGPRRAVVQRLVSAGAVALTAGAVAFPFAALDRYRRADLRGPRDGPLVLAVCRQSLAFARRLEAGRTVAYDVRARRFRPGRDDPRFLERMRWFLRDGWGDKPHYGTGPALMRARRATLLLPCLRPDDWTLTLALRAPRPAALAVTLNGRELHRAAFEGDLRLKVQVPRDALFRGDNRLALVSPDDDPGVELVDLRVQPPR